MTHDKRERSQHLPKPKVRDRTEYRDGCYASKLLTVYCDFQNPIPHVTMHAEKLQQCTLNHTLAREDRSHLPPDPRGTVSCFPLHPILLTSPCFRLPTRDLRFPRAPVKPSWPICPLPQLSVLHHHAALVLEETNPTFDIPQRIAHPTFPRSPHGTAIEAAFAIEVLFSICRDDTACNTFRAGFL